MPERDILDEDSKYFNDSKITKTEHHSNFPFANSFKYNDEISISVQQTDARPYLHDSFL